MKIVSLSQIIVFLLFCFLLFGDLQNFKKHLNKIIKYIRRLIKK